MAHLRIPVFLLGILFIVIAITFSSFHPQKKNYEVEGYIHYEDGTSNTSVRILLSHDKIFPSEIEHPDTKHTYTLEKGYFYSEIAAPANSSIYLTILKEGYFPVSYKVETADYQGKSIKISEKILVAGKINVPVEGSSNGLAMEIFEDACVGNPERQLITRNEVLYLRDLSYSNCRIADWPLIEASVVWSNHTSNRYHFNPRSDGSQYLLTKK